MAHFLRLILLAAASCLPLSAFAAFPAPTEWQFPATGYNPVGPWLSNKQAACDSRLANFASFGVTYATLEAGDQCSPRYSSGGVFSTFILNSRSSCPANSTGTTSCTCSAGYVEEGSACVTPPDPGEEHCQSINGSPVKASWTTTSPSLSSRTICMTNGGYSCTATVEGDICGSSGAGGSYLCHGSGVSGGSSGGTTCTPSTQPDAPAAPGTPDTNWPDAPPPGTCPGTVNGVAVNVPCSNTNSSATKTEEFNDGAGNITSKSETKVTACNAAGSCTTTTSTTTSVNGGTPTTTTKSTTESKGQFCAGNPGSKECGDGDGSSFGGNCEGAFTCSGDAVQCALTLEVHRQNCKINEETPEGLLYDQEKGREGNRTEDLPGNESIAIGPSSFDDSDAIGGAQCVSDLTVSIWLVNATLPISNICPHMAWLRYALLALGGLGWMLIVFRK